MVPQLALMEAAHPVSGSRCSGCLRGQERIVVLLTGLKVVVWSMAVVVLWLWSGPVAAQEVTDGVADDISSDVEEAEDEPIDEDLDGVVAEHYAAEFSVSVLEAERRLGRIRPIHDVLARIRDIEGSRLAGWGIDHQSMFSGWVLLVGDNPPSSEAAAVAGEVEDVEIRVGVVSSYEQLLEAQHRFGSQDWVTDVLEASTPDPQTPGNGTGLGVEVAPTGPGPGIGITDEVPRVGIDPSSSAAGLDETILAGVLEMVSFTDIDMSANALEIGINPERTSGSLGVVSDEVVAEKAAWMSELLGDHN